jgi:phage-related protein (TIGR01555 family)
MENDWRDASVLQACYRHLRGWDSSVQSISHMLADGSQAVLSIDGMLNLANDVTVLTNRMRVLEMARALRIMPIDAEREKFQFVQRSFAGIDKVLEVQMLSLGGASKTPLTVLFGRSPAGLNATGESDTRTWYDRVGSERRTIYQPKLERLVYLAAIVAKAGEPESWGVEWPSLWQMTSTEQAEHRARVAGTDIDLVAAGVLTEDEVTRHRFGEGG